MNRLSQQESKADGMFDSIKPLQTWYGNSFKKFEAAQASVQNSMRESQQKNEEILQATRDQAKLAVDSAKLAVASLEELKRETLDKLQGTEAELVELKKEQKAWADNLDNRWHLRSHKHGPLNEFFAWMQD